MSKCLGLLTLFAVTMLLSIFGSPLVAPAADKETPTKIAKVAGILFEKQAKWLTVKGDGEEEPVKYEIPEGADKTLVDALKSNFPACRVQITYKKDGESRQLVSIKRQILKKDGTITGVVVKVHNDFWIELKPKNGLADAFAPGGNYKDKDFMAKLKGLMPGETVTIKYTTDGERHRISTLTKKR